MKLGRCGKEQHGHAPFSVSKKSCYCCSAMKRPIVGLRKARGIFELPLLGRGHMATTVGQRCGQIAWFQRCGNCHDLAALKAENSKESLELDGKQFGPPRERCDLDDEESALLTGHNLASRVVCCGWCLDPAAHPQRLRMHLRCQNGIALSYPILRAPPALYRSATSLELVLYKNKVAGNSRSCAARGVYQPEVTLPT